MPQRSLANAQAMAEQVALNVSFTAERAT